MAEHMPANCSNCRHFESREDKCHRFPPQLFSMHEVSYDSAWPFTPPADSCGEWTPKITPLQGFKAFEWLKTIIARAEQEGCKDAWAPLRDAREWLESIDN